MKKALAALLLIAPHMTFAGVIFTDRLSFEATLGSSITDNYSAAGYATGNIIDNPSLDVHSSANMSSVLGETDYTSTSFVDNNIVFSQSSDPGYCAGCNGSFELGFTTTSVGTASGVFGVGFEYFSSGATALITFGDGTTSNIALGNVPAGTFFGITSDSLIQSLHVGFPDGVPVKGFEGISTFIDNLTIGSGTQVQVPEPSTLGLLALGLVGLGLARRRGRDS